MNVYHGLLFTSGHIVDPELAQRLGRERAPQPAAPAPESKQPAPRHNLRWWLEELVVLGGRPLSKGHNDDLDEPFPPLHPDC